MKIFTKSWIKWTNFFPAIHKTKPTRITPLPMKACLQEQISPISDPMHSCLQSLHFFPIYITVRRGTRGSFHRCMRAVFVPTERNPRVYVHLVIFFCLFIFSSSLGSASTHELLSIFVYPPRTDSYTRREAWTRGRGRWIRYAAPLDWKRKHERGEGPDPGDRISSRNRCRLAKEVSIRESVSTSHTHGMNSWGVKKVFYRYIGRSRRGVDFFGSLADRVRDEDSLE